MSLLRAFKWSFLSELAAKIIQPVIFIILARLLTPEDFGVMTAALMVIGFTQVFWEAGMGKALIQRQTDTQEAANAAFWINIALGGVIALLLFLVAEPVARIFFQDPRVTAVLKVMTLLIFLGAVSSVHTALLQKEMGFKKLFWVRFATVGVPGIASIPLAWQGMGYWALVAGTLVGQLAQVIMLWRMSHWRPQLTFDTRVAKEMGRFGAWVGVTGLLSWFYLWADALIVGMYLGSHELGLYRTGNQFTAMIFAMLFGALAPVLYSYLSRMNRDRPRMARAAERVIKTISCVAVPVALVLFSVSESLADDLFGDTWDGLGLVIGVMALMHGFSWVVGMNGEMYRAMGKPAYETIVTAGTMLIYLLAYLYSIQFGFEAFVWTRLLLALGAIILHLLILRRILKLEMRPIVSYLLALSLLCIATIKVTGLILENFITNDLWGVFAIHAMLSMAVIGGTLLLFEKNGLVKEIRNLIKKDPE